MFCLDEDESRFTGPSAAQILKCVASKQSSTPVIEGTVKEVICDMLNTLVVKYHWKPQDDTCKC